MTLLPGSPSMVLTSTSSPTAVGDEVEVNTIDGEPGSSVTLPALLLVDGATVTTDADALAAATVTAEVVGHGKGLPQVQERDRLPQQAGPPARPSPASR